jgi:ATP-dependent DNA ligase
MKPMLARFQAAPPVGDYLYEPKYDGLRCVVSRDGAKISLDSRNERPLNRFFPELVHGLLNVLPRRCVVDGEIVIEGPEGLDFAALLQRVHPAVARVTKLSTETPATFVAFDLLELGSHRVAALPFRERRHLLGENLIPSRPLSISPITADLAQAQRWFAQFDKTGFDGILAKDPSLPYLENKRAMIKVKHQRTADCVIGGYRKGAHGNGAISLLLGLYDEARVLRFVGVAGGFAAAEGKRLDEVLAPLAKPSGPHPWLSGDAAVPLVLPGPRSDWSPEAKSEWIPVEPRRVAEVAYDVLQGERFRHTTHLLRLRDDRDADSCNFSQLCEMV